MRCYYSFVTLYTYVYDIYFNDAEKFTQLMDLPTRLTYVRIMGALIQKKITR